MLYSKLLHMQLLNVFLNLTSNEFYLFFFLLNDLVYLHRVS